MADESVVRFENFRLDLRNECLWRGTELLPLTPKAFAVLRYLVERPGQLVSKSDSFKAVWPDTAVGDAVLTVGIGELRKALGDDPQSPRFIETVHRRGYRFLGEVIGNQFLAGSPFPATFPVTQLATGHGQRAAHLVGRETELAQLHGWLGKALGGERQIVFVTGEPGIGKTALVETFLGQAAAGGRCWIGHGQCIEHYGVGEAYFPVFTVLGQLCRAPGTSHLRELLSRHAPTWLVQIPGLLDAAAFETLRSRTQGATRERMLRELAEAVEALTAEQPVVLVLEDLHWSDYATLDLLSFVARRRQVARLLVLGTYRPAEVSMREHPLGALTQDLQVRGQCAELALGLLSAAAVGEYLGGTFPAHRLPDTLAGALHRRTSGNPLFLVKVVQDWVSRGVLVEVGGQWVLRRAVEEVADTVPPSLRQLIEGQLAGLSPHDQRVLEVASIAGEEFSAAIVAAGVGEELEEVEERCEEMVRRAQVLKARGTAEWPDGTVAARYGFVHALYREVLYKRVSVGRRARLHQQVGRRLEGAYGARVEEIAGELAVHFERGREHAQAVRYLEQAGRRALRRSAPHEAVHHLRAALRLLQTQPDTLARTRQELALQTIFGLALMSAKGYGAPEVEQAYARAHALCQQVEETAELFSVLVGIATFRIVRGEFELAYQTGEQLLRMAERAPSPGGRVGAHTIMAVVSFYRGEFVSARRQLEQSLALDDPPRPHSHGLQYGPDPGVTCRCYLAWVLWFLGLPEQALRRSQEAVAHARDRADPLSLVFALSFAASLHGFRREPQAAAEQAEVMMALATEQGLPFWLAQGTFARSRALIQQGRLEEGVTQLDEILQAERGEWRKARPPLPLATLAEGYGALGHVERGLLLLAEALTTIASSGERWWEAEVYRLRGELTLQPEVKGGSSEVPPPSPPGFGLKGSAPSGAAQKAEEDFLRAVAVARRQGAKALELRAVMSLGRLRQRQGKREEARRLLAKTYGWFTEGFETKDLREAQALLAELSERGEKS